MYDTIYRGNTQQKPKKRIDDNLYDVQHIIKNGQKPDSFVANYEKHFKYIMLRIDLRKCMPLK